MLEVKIYDFDFNLIASDFKCISLDWDVRFNSVGTFEGVFTLDSPIYSACSNNEFAICVQGENQGIVTNINVKDDRIFVSGRSMNYILEKRVCMPFSSTDYGYDMTEAEIVCKLVQKHCGDFMEVLLPPEIGKAGSFTSLEARPLGEVISEILQTVNCGHFVKVDIENEKWIFGCRVPEYTSIVLSRPDNTMENCDYVRNIDDYAVGGVYKQKMKFMGSWNADVNQPVLFDEDSRNFAKAYLVAQSGTCFGKSFVKGNYVYCKDVSGKLVQGSEYDDFWYKIYTDQVEGPLKWEHVLSCRDIEDAKHKLYLKEISENVTAITRGTIQKDLNTGDVVEVRLTSGQNPITFKRQVKKMIYHYEWGNCFVKPVFGKMKENDDE